MKLRAIMTKWNVWTDEEVDGSMFILFDFFRFFIYGHVYVSSHTTENSGMVWRSVLGIFRFEYEIRGHLKSPPKVKQYKSVETPKKAQNWLPKLATNVRPQWILVGHNAYACGIGDSEKLKGSKCELQENCTDATKQKWRLNSFSLLTTATGYYLEIITAPSTSNCLS